MRSIILGVLVLGRGLRDALAEQVVVDHLPRDRRGGSSAEAGILDQHRERDLGILDRRERDEERVIAMPLGGARLVVLFALLDRDHLRRAGLAGAGVARALEGTRPGALLVDAGH